LSDIGDFEMARISFASVKWIVLAATLLVFVSDVNAFGHRRRRGGCCNDGGYAGGYAGGYDGGYVSYQDSGKSMTQAPDSAVQAPGKSMTQAPMNPVQAPGKSMQQAPQHQVQAPGKSMVQAPSMKADSQQYSQPAQSATPAP
jgi:hypothetical protein